MAIASADLNGHTSTHVRMTIPAWGASYHDVSLDGDVTLTGAVTLTVADLVIKGTVLSGGPGGSGRSYFRIVAGAGGWGKTLPAKSYANDAGVKILTVLGDASASVGETLDTTTIDPLARVGPYFVRPEGPACRLLEQLYPGGWYVSESGLTRIGARPAGATLDATATRTTQLDLASGTVTLASETIVNILPGIVVDGIAAVDVEHTIDAKAGLRSKLWGQQGSVSGSASPGRLLPGLRAIVDQLDPNRRFRACWEYRIVTQDGARLNLQPVRVSTGMPDLSRVMVRPGIPGFSAQHTLGSRVVVGFLDGNPSQPFVASFEDFEGGGFSPTSLSISAGGQSPTEHLITAEAVALMIYNTLAALCAANVGPLVGATLATTLATAVTAAITETATPAPPGATAQTALATTLASASFPNGLPTYTSLPFSSAIATALAAKTPDAIGAFPGVGCPDVKGG